jgi:hypothetical protein
LHEQTDPKTGRSYVLSNLGNIERYDGNLDRACDLYRESLLLKQEVGDTWAISYTLESCAALAVARGRGERAAWLLGAASAIRQYLGTPLEPFKREEYETNLAAARELLAPETFDIEWEEGKGLSVEQAVEYAVAEESIL